MVNVGKSAMCPWATVKAWRSPCLNWWQGAASMLAKCRLSPFYSLLSHWSVERKCRSPTSLSCQTRASISWFFYAIFSAPTTHFFLILQTTCCTHTLWLWNAAMPIDSTNDGITLTLNSEFGVATRFGTRLTIPHNVSDDHPFSPCILFSSRCAQHVRHGWLIESRILSVLAVAPHFVPMEASHTGPHTGREDSVTSASLDSARCLSWVLQATCSYC